jgi:hypothetical protein
MDIKEKISNVTTKAGSKKGAILLGSLGLIAGVAGTMAVATYAAAPQATVTAATTQTQAPGQHGHGQFTPPAASGNVTAVSGNTITLTDKKSGTTYTVDATNATVNKFTAGTNGAKGTQATITVSQIAVGDNITVQGTVSGANITATKIEDGMMMGFGGRGHGPMGMGGQMGTVSSISGNTITLTGKNGTTYTIDASNSKVEKVSTVSVSNIAVGDSLMVQGTTSGTTVTAKNIVDGQFPMGGNKPASSSSTSGQ